MPCIVPAYGQRLLAIYPLYDKIKERKNMKCKKKLILLAMLLLGGMTLMNAESFYDLSAAKIDGSMLDFSTLRGHKVMVVNTASKCGFTPQYADLQALHEEYGDTGFVIIGFPSNDFLRQEPGSNEDIEAFCSQNYGVTFTMMEKVSVKKSARQNNVYQWLTQKVKNGFSDNKVKWNFQKYLVDETGKLVRVIPPRTKPSDKSIVKWITGNVD